MKKLTTLLLSLVTTCTDAAVEVTKCEEHPYELTVAEVGFEHVNHRVVLNGKIHIKELEEAMWFVESVTCTNDGFAIIASHVQYSEPSKQQFSLWVTGADRYEIK